MHDHYLLTMKKSQNSVSHMIPSYQYSLTQQALEMYLVFYLINLVLLQAKNRKIFLTTYPNPLIHSNGRKLAQFSFPGRSRRRSTELKRDPLRAIILVSKKYNDAYNCLLMGTTGSLNMHDFLAKYETRQMLGNNYQLNLIVLK
jgi:hypothetical protein